MTEQRFALPLIHRAEDGTVTLEWQGDEQVALCSREIVEWLVDTVNANVRLESQNQALQERAERAEHLLQAIAFDDQGKLQAWLQPLYIREPYVTVLVDKATQLLSPTQETDPE